ncbi:AMMECR1 domain protein [Candidatus Nitrososphaera gargensis Ga9.2]|uniref:Protein Ngar_c17860 n=1 Tax=Nitrososphaera gargensis (strain Ga9.2) TaxID=1237085 RepID=K0IN42_NITGG|nr:AMMECR1 domain protein [Candidatus Nitrososphaera gargensis Ga9.2]
MNCRVLISDSEGAELVRLARKAVETYLRESVIIQPEQDAGRAAGVFVTLNYLTRNKEEHLRGCIGFPLPEKELYQSVVEAAIAAATEDPRFPPVDKQELDSIIFEVSVLTPPEEIRTKSAADYRKEIKIGRDGLVLRWRYGSGLLLPQVPVELKWNVDQYLANICYKAGAPADAWLDPASKLYRFQAIVFKEVEPRGKVTRLEL